MSLNISVIGTGHLGGIHVKLLAGQKDINLAGIFDTDSDRANKLAAEYGCERFDSLQNAIDGSDALVIASPTTSHFEIARQCIESGRHCFIEKPITSAYEEAGELIHLARKRDILVQVGHVERFNPAIAAIRKYDLDPMFIEAHRLSQFRPRATDVSVIHDLMIHDIDIMLWMVKSEVVEISSNGVGVLTDTTDIANARISFENGAVANLTASRISARPMRKMRLFQRDTYISIDFAAQDVEVYHLRDEGESKPDNETFATMLGSIEAGTKNKSIYLEKPKVPELNAIEEEQKAFADAIVSGSQVPVGAEDAAEALRIAEEISLQIDNQFS